MTCPPVSSAERKPQSNTVGPDFCQLWPRTSEAGLQLAKDAPIKPAPRSPKPLDYRPSEALVLLAAMRRDRQAAINRLDMRAVNEIEAYMRAVTRAMMARVP